MTHKSLRNTVGIASLTALALTMVACGGSSSSTPATPVAVNLAPTGVTVSGSSAGKVGHTQIFNLSATDPDGDSATITYTLTPAVAGASISGKVLTFTPTVTGTAVLTVTATDVKGATATGTTAVLVAANQAPTFTAASTVNIGAGATAQSFVVGNATDADGDNVTYSLAAGGPAWVTFNATTRTLTVAPTGAVVAGAYTVTLNATDGFTGGTASQTITINVGALPAGTITGYPSNTTVIYRGLPFNFQFSAGSPLAGDTIVGYALDNGAGGTQPANSSVTASGLFTWTPSATIALGDPVFFGVTATFASGVKAYQTFQLTPSVSNSAPTWSAATSYMAPTKLNGTTDATLASTYGAVLSWAGSTANSYTVPLTGITTTDVDITPTTDAVTFTVTKAVIVGDATATDVTAQITANGGSLTFVPGTLTPNTYAAGTLTFVAPETGKVKVGAVNLGQATTTSFVVGTAGNLKVTITGTDKGGLTATHVVEIPVRRNAAPVVDNKAAGGAANTSGDDTTDVTIGAIVGVFANPAPAYGVSNTWTIYTLSATASSTAGGLGEATDANADPMSAITISNAKVDNVADGRISGSLVSNNLVVQAPVWTAADARKPYSFDVVATDKFGAKSMAVTFKGSINGTVTGTQANSWIGGSGAAATTTKTNYSFAGGGQTVTMNPYYESGPAGRIGMFNNDLVNAASPLAQVYAMSGDASGNFSVTSVPGSVFYAKTNVVTGYPTSWTHYSNASTFHYDIFAAGRTSVFAPAAKVAVASAAGTLITAHFQYVNTFDKNNDVFQIINWNLGTKHFASADAGTGPNYFRAGGATAWPYANTTVFNATNNLADLDFTTNYYMGLSGTDANFLVDYVKGDTLMFGRMTSSALTDTLGAAKIWQLQTYATPSLASTFVMGTGGANNMNATFDPFFNYQANSMTGAISRSLFNNNMLLATNATISPVYVGESLSVIAQPHGTANGAIETGAPTLLQVEDLGGNASFNGANADNDVDFGTLKFGSLPNTTPVVSYSYNYNVPTTGVAGGFAAGSNGFMDTTIPTTGAIAPKLAPISNLMVSTGADADDVTTFVNAFVDTGVDPDGAGALPVTVGAKANTTATGEGQIVLKWDAPATPISGYVVTIWNVTAADIANLNAAPDATIYTAKTSLLLSKGANGVLSNGATGQMYLVRIKAVNMPGVDFNVDPFKMAFPYSWAESFSGVITLQ